MPTRHNELFEKRRIDDSDARTWTCLCCGSRASHMTESVSDAQSLTVCNLTEHEITLKAIEQCEASDTLTPWMNFTWNSSSSSSRGAPRDDMPHRRQRSAIGHQSAVFLKPWSRQQIEMAPPAFHPNTSFNVELEDKNGISVLTTSQGPISAPQPDAQISKDAYTAVYLQASSMLVILQPSNTTRWMQDFDDSTSIAALSIPGSHNSPTYYRALPSVRCQAVSIPEQLQNGIRFLDVRVQPTSDIANETLKLVHGAFPISITGPKTFRKLVEDVQSFLAENPSETIILSLKREGIGNATDEQLSLILRDHYVRDDEQRWYTEPRVPTLGETRGKIVMMRRFALDPQLQSEHRGQGWGVDAESWPYNKPFCTYHDVCVQDYCELASSDEIDLKIEYCCEHIERAGSVRHAPNHAGKELLFLNFLSATNFWKAGTWPQDVAARINPAIVSYLCDKKESLRAHGDGSTGIVICDWLGRDGDWTLVHCILGMNAKVRQLQQRRQTPVETEADADTLPKSRT